MWGTFEKIQTYSEVRQGPSGTPDDSRLRGYSVTWWDLEQTGTRVPEPSYGLFGVLPALAAGLLVIGAVLALTAVRNRRSGAVTGTRVASALGIGLLAGAVGVQLVETLDRLSDVNDRPVDEGDTITYDIGLGVWLPLGAVAVGLIGLILVLTRARPATAGRLEPETPRMGFPAPYGPGPQPPTPQQFQQRQPPAAGPQPTTGPQATSGPPSTYQSVDTLPPVQSAQPAESRSDEPTTRPAERRDTPAPGQPTEPEQPPERT